MDLNRRTFLKIGAVALLGLVSKPVVDMLTRVDLVHASGEADVALKKNWAMIVDLNACKSKSGCTACIDICHRIHNVPDIGNPKDEVKWIWKVPYEGAFPGHQNEFVAANWKGKPVIVLCNHCADAPCVKVCPTQATWKREDGIVMMDYHRCIGCRYCMAACPYGSRSFNWRDPRPFIANPDPGFPTRTKGVVEKCNFCEERLADGKIPACVEACTEKALIFGNLNDPDSQVRKILSSKYSILRKPELGTNPKVYYLV
jgi:Fe-S-cluster-containing dehydrogenase component